MPPNIPSSADLLSAHIRRKLAATCRSVECYPPGAAISPRASAVLLLLGHNRRAQANPGELCLILNKRSAAVKQPGDLCFPGGRPTPRLDACLATLLALPFAPLGAWPYWRAWRASRPREARRLALLLATSLRESLEEMRLNPMDVRFLGPLPPQRLPMFGRVIYPMAGWVRRQQRFRPNREVAKVVPVPLRQLMSPERYACYRLTLSTSDAGAALAEPQDFPCFVYADGTEREILWGATFRIVTVFLKLAFDFEHPPLPKLPVITASRGNEYLRGANA